MELSWSTFVLEIVNFLVLVWILKRFLYKPVTDAIARRRERIEQILEAAREQYRTGEALREQYQDRLAEWEREKETARTELQRAIERERRDRLAALTRELEDERKKREVVAERGRRESQRRLEGQALGLAGRFSALLLGRLADAALERKLLQVLLEDLPGLPEERRWALEQALRQGYGPVEVTSAYPLDEGQRQGLERTLSDMAGRPVACRYRQEPALVAGVRLQLGAWVLHADLRGELRGFTEAGHE